MAVTTTSISVLNSSSVAQSMGTNTDPGGVQVAMVSLDRAGSALYRMSASFTPQATAAVTLLSVQGSATKTVRIKKIIVTGVSTATATIPVQLIRSTALGAGGTTVNPTQAKLDSGTVSSATAVVAHYTSTLKAAGTSTSIGPLASGRLFTSKVTTPDIAIAAIPFVFPEFGGPLSQGIVLRGTSDFIELQNTNAGNLSAGTVIDYSIEWEEDGS